MATTPHRQAALALLILAGLGAITVRAAGVDAAGQQVSVLSKLTPVYRAAKGVEAIATGAPGLSPMHAQVSAAIQALGTEILVAEDLVSNAKERQALVAYRQAFELYRASLSDLQIFESATAQIGRPSGEVGQIKVLEASLKSITVRDLWTAAHAQLSVAHAKYLGRVPPLAVVTVEQRNDEGRFLLESGRIGLELRTATGEPVPVAVEVRTSFAGRTGPPETIDLRFITSPVVAAQASRLQLSRAGQPIEATSKIDGSTLTAKIPAVAVANGTAALTGTVFGQAFVLTSAQQGALTALVQAGKGPSE